MTTTVRMDSATERLLDDLARERGSTKSEVVREAVRLVAK
jgi:predicted transcriptional regulator